MSCNAWIGRRAPNSGRWPTASNGIVRLPARIFLAAVVCVEAGIVAASPTAAQSLPAFGGARLFQQFSLDGDTREWDGRQAFELVASPAGGRAGRIWVAQVEKGLAVAGELQGPPPRWSEAGSDSGDRIEVRLSDDEAAVLPPIGWGNQFGFAYLESEKDCDWPETEPSGPRLERECKSWRRLQVDYRLRLQKLFERVWRVTPSEALERAATPAFESLQSEAGAKLSALKPAAVPPEFKIEASERGGPAAYRFELLIPWQAFPPMRPLRLDAVRFRVDVFGFGKEEGKRRSSTVAEISDEAALNRFTLPLPRDYFLTPCRYEPSQFQIDTGPGRGRMKASEKAQLYFQPQAELELDRLIVIENEVKGYQYEPDPGIRSPIAYTASFYSRELGGGRTVCWPILTLVQGERVSSSGALTASGAEVEFKRLSASRTLVKVGPRVSFSYYGSGQCGACPRVLLQIFSLDLDSGSIIQAFDFYEVVMAMDIDIEVSEDWTTVTIFTREVDPAAGPGAEWVWTATRHCLNSTFGSYRQCGRRSPVPGPHPRRIKPLDQD